MKTDTRKKPLCISIYFNRKTKASREQVAGIFRFAGEHPDWELHLFTRPDTPEEMYRMTSSFVPHGIIAGHPAVVEAFYRRLRRPIPSVLIDYAASRPSRAQAIVLCDDHAIGAQAAETFLKRGYRAFAFAGITGGSGDSDAVNSENREHGFCRALQKAGYACDVYRERLERNSLHYRDETKLKNWLRALPRPCALMAHSDFLAQSILTVCRKARITVPEQIAVIGVDNEESICESTAPKLSSIEPDFSGGGYLAADLLDGILRRNRRTLRHMRAIYGVLQMTERMSTQNVLGTHLRIARAREIIRTEALGGIRAAEIASRLGVSERLLEMTFRKALGHTVRDELTTIRLTEAKRLLGKTEKTSAEISALCGFRTPSAFKALFRKRFSLSPRAYRSRVRKRSEEPRL